MSDRPFLSWVEQFQQFATDFEIYLAEFPENGWYRRYLDDYRRLFDAILAGENFHPQRQPYQSVHAAVVLMLDGRKKLTPLQRRLKKGLLVRWQRLHNSAGIRGREGLDKGGPSFWSGCKACAGVTHTK